MTGADSFGALPMILRQIAEASSLEAALRLAAARGGTRIYVPKQAPEGHWLVRCMGQAGADALCRLYGGEAIVLPADPRRGQQARVRAIRRGIEEQLSADTVASAAGVTRRQIFWHKAKMRERGNRRQKDLFDD